MVLLRRLLIVQVALLWPVWSSAALIDATSSVSAKCHTGPADTATGVPVETTASCDANTLGNILSSAAVATRFGGVFPQVGEVVTSATLARGEVVGAPSTTFASGVVGYYFAIDQVGLPPFMPTTIPIRFRASGEVSVSGDTTVTSGAEAFIPGIDGAYLGVELLGPGKISFDDSLLLAAEIGEPYFTLVGAICNLRLGTPGTAASCSASADPFLTFDQQAFDAMQPDTFPLDRFFDINYSANVQFDSPPGVVSEPSPLSLLCGAIALLSAVRVRRRRLHRSQ